MISQKLAIATNSSWNVWNFRSGLIAGLQEDGWRVTVIAPRDSATPKLEAMGVDYVEVEMDPKGMSPAKDFRLTADYVRILRNVRPHVFLGFTPKPNAFGSIAARLLRIPTINNMTGMAFVERKGLARLLPMQLLKAAFRGASTVFFQNSDDRALFLAARIVKPAQARLVPGSGIDLSKFVPSPPKSLGCGDAEEFRFLLPARILREKGILEYVEAARRVGNKAARFQLLGFLDAQSPTAIRSEDVRRWHAEGVIDYVGHTDDVRPFMAQSDCVVLPSYREGLPRVLLEAAAMGKPIIATDVPGCRELVEHGVNGFACRPRDAQSLAEAMNSMLRETKSARLAMGASARAKAVEKYDERIVCESYKDAIARALARES